MTQNTRILVGVAVCLLGLFLLACRTPQEKSAAFIAAGKQDLEAGHYTHAILRFKIAAHLTPKDANAHYYLGVAHWRAGDFGEAASELKTATELNPRHVQARIKLSEIALRFGHGDTLVQTEKQVQQILATYPNNADAWYTLAIADWRLGKSDAAFEHLKQALARLPRHLESAVALATMQLERRDFAAAEKTILEAAGQAPESVDAAIAVGRFYLTAGKATEAERHLRRALAMDPQSGPGLLALGETQIAMGNRPQAERTFAQLSTIRDKTYRAVHASYLLNEKRYSEAIPELRQLLQKDPANPALRSYLVAAYVGANRPADAEALLKNALGRNKQDLDASLQYSEFLLRTRRLREAETGLATVLRFHSDLAQAHVLLAAVYEARHEMRSQQRELLEALRVRPDQLPARLRLARSLLTTGNARQALAVLDQAPQKQNRLLDLQAERNWALLALERWPELRSQLDIGLAASPTPELLLQDGLLKFHLKQYEAAASAFRDVLRRNPEDIRAISSLARLYVAQQRIDAAETMIANYAARYPKSAQLQVFIGGWMASTGRLDQARRAFLLAKIADPAYDAADLALARVAIMERKWDEARSILNPLCSREPSAAHMLLAGVDEQVGAASSAIGHYRKAIAEDSRNAVALNNIAYLLANDPARLDEALGYATKALQFAPSPDLYDTIGWLYYRKGLYRLAVRFLEKAMAANGNALCSYHLAMAYFKEGDPARGRVALKAALAMDPNLENAR